MNCCFVAVFEFSRCAYGAVLTPWTHRLLGSRRPSGRIPAVHIVSVASFFAESQRAAQEISILYCVSEIFMCINNSVPYRVVRCVLYFIKYLIL